MDRQASAALELVALALFVFDDRGVDRDLKRVVGGNMQTNP